MAKPKAVLSGTWGGERRSADEKGRMSLVASWTRALVRDNASDNALPRKQRRSVVLVFTRADRPATVMSLAAWNRLDPKKRERRYLLKYQTVIDAMGRIPLLDARLYLGEETFLQRSGNNIRVWPGALWDREFGKPVKVGRVELRAPRRVRTTPRVAHG